MSVSIWSVKDLCRPSAGKESACNSGDLGSIPESRRSPGEGIGYPLQYSWASLVVQLVICLQCWRPGFDPGVGKISWRRQRLSIPAVWPGEYIVHGVAKSHTQLSDIHFHFVGPLALHNNSFQSLNFTSDFLFLMQLYIMIKIYLRVFVLSHFSCV